MNEQDIMYRIMDLEQQVRSLTERVLDLEDAQQQQQRQADADGYAAHGARYHGKHPRSCACDRCLGIRYR